ncbi:MAG: ornithine carbamoyltransferase [Clostridia bacterium]|nr:ornithine carbamoyltransferase [Clostridia bacterium]
MSLYKKHFLKMLDLSAAEIEEYLRVAALLKEKKKAGVPHDMLRGKNIALLFEKTSTRTRCAFEVAAADLGMHAVYLDPKSSQLGKKESIADTAKVLGRMFDAIEYRGYGQEIVEEIARESGVPTFNGLTNESHPTQILADFLTIREEKGTLKGLTLAYYGDARYNMGNSLMVGAAKVGMNFTACCPEKYFPDPALVAKCREIAAETGSVLRFETDPAKGSAHADAVYTDVWVSMGEPAEVWEERIADLSPYRVTTEVMAGAKEDAIFLHCLPAFHDLGTEIGRAIHERFGLTEMEVSDEVFLGKQSKVFDEAENRLHTIKSVIALSLCDSV